MIVSDTLAVPELEAALGRPLDAVERTCLGRGLRAFVEAGLPPEAAADALVASLDEAVGRQIDEILHHPAFQALESAWRGVWLLVSRADRSQGVRVEVLNCSKEDLLLDFEDSPEVSKSGLYRIVYGGEYASFGGRPVAAILANYELDPGDLPLLRLCCDVAAITGLAFLAAASPALAAPEPRPAWTAFRERPVARFAGLIFPRALGRVAHRIHAAPQGTASFAYDETIARHDDHLWQNAVFALGVCIARSFERWRLACDITGPVGGGVELPTWSGRRGPASTESRLWEQAEEDLAARGIIPLGTEARTGRAIFRRAPTCLAPSAPAPADLAPDDLDLHRQLPALFLVTRFAQTLKVAHRESISTWRTLDELREGSSALLAGWTHAPEPEERGGDDGPRHLRAGRPLRRFELRIEDVPGNLWWRRFDLRISPSWGHAGRPFTLAIDGKLDRE